MRSGRARLLASVDAACEHGARKQRDNDLGQHDLFGGDDHAGGAPGHALPEVPSWTEIEQLNYEKEALGLYWSGHPIDRYAEDLREYGAKTTADLNIKKPAEEGDEIPADAGAGFSRPNGNGKGEEISIGGIVSGLRPLKTRKGDRMCVLMLDDASGSIEIVVFPEAFKQHGHLAENGKTVLVKGIAHALGIDEVDVTSPSFTLVNPHQGRLLLYHIDLYRLDEGAAAAHAVDLDEILRDEHGVVVIEWAERMGRYPLPDSVARISIAGDGDESRRILVS